MAAVTKIVFLGASSASFGISMFRDLFSSQDLAGSTLVLVGRNPERHRHRRGRSLRGRHRHHRHCAAAARRGRGRRATDPVAAERADAAGLR
ncbi:MAG: hypothetical protein B7Z53_00300 [Rhodospirillales bacterium 12-71-4]|nr:MAG: hypothetical protein B7Z53_00300 [Rhodospirillales bacterium 12-71-4]